MADLERTYNVPLRKGFMNTPKHKRAKKAVSTLKNFLKKHMKSQEVKLGQHLNKHMWKHGIKNPPHHVKVKAVKDEEGVVKAELEGHEFAESVRPSSDAMPEGLRGKMEEAKAQMTGGEDSSEEREDKEDKEKKEEESDKKDEQSAGSKASSGKGDSKSKKKSSKGKKSSSADEGSSGKKKSDKKKSGSKKSKSDS